MQRDRQLRSWKDREESPGRSHGSGGRRLMASLTGILAAQVVIYALMGVVVFWVCFIIVDKITPYDLWGEIVEKKNVALAIVVGIAAAVALLLVILSPAPS